MERTAPPFFALRQGIEPEKKHGQIEGEKRKKYCEIFHLQEG